MYEKKFIADAVRRSATTEVDRRKLFAMVGLAGAGAAAATMVGGTAADAATVSDGAILNFALNLEYLEAEFYLHAVSGEGLKKEFLGGVGRYGGVIGGHKVPWTKGSPIYRFAHEIAHDEHQHVNYLRTGLGASAVTRPTINFTDAFTGAARAAGVVGPKGTFDPFANETNFLLGAFLFEDVGVTAYKGAAPLISNKGYLEAAAGILAVEAYHAGQIRSSLFRMAEDNHGLWDVVQKLSDARDAVDDNTQNDQSIRIGNATNIQPTDANSIAFSRTPGAVLNIVYLNTTKAPVSSGGFFPNGVNVNGDGFVTSDAKS